MAAREFLSFQVVNAIEADIETAIENTEKGQGLEVFSFGKQICFLAYADT